MTSTQHENKAFFLTGPLKTPNAVIMLLVHRFSESGRCRAPHSTELTDYRISSSLQFNGPVNRSKSALSFNFKNELNMIPK